MFPKFVIIICVSEKQILQQSLLVLIQYKRKNQTSVILNVFSKLKFGCIKGSWKVCTARSKTCANIVIEVLDINIYSFCKECQNIKIFNCEVVSIVYVILIHHLKLFLNYVFKILRKNARKTDVSWPHGTASHHKILC